MQKDDLLWVECEMSCETGPESGDVATPSL